MATTKSRADILSLVRPAIRELMGYEAIEPAEVLAERLGVPADQVVKLDGNENPYGPSPRVLAALGSYESYARYGDPQQRKLREALAAYTGVGPENVVAGHGADELIDVIVRAVLEPGEAAIDCPPTFGMYGFSTRVQGGRIINIERNDDFTIDLDAMRAAAGQAKIVFVASPNNPTGNPLSQDELEALLATGLLVVVDEAYVEFSGGSFAPLVTEHENLVVLRTMSKWAALAGLRAGYGIMAGTLADVLMHAKTPYTPNIAAEIAMLISLEDKERLMEGVQAMVEERERMRAQLQAQESVAVYPSQANFLLCKLAGVSGRDARDALAQQGIFIRYFDTPRLQDCVRISVGLAADTDRVVEALGNVGGARG